MWQPKLDFGKLSKTSTLPSIFFTRFPMSPSGQDLRFISCKKTGMSRSNSCELEEENRGEISQTERKKKIIILDAHLLVWVEVCAWKTKSNSLCRSEKCSAVLWKFSVDQREGIKHLASLNECYDVCFSRVSGNFLNAVPRSSACWACWGGCLGAGLHVLQRERFFPASVPAASADLEQNALWMLVSLMAGFRGKAGPLGDCSSAVLILTRAWLAADWIRAGRELSFCREWFWGKRISSVKQKVSSRTQSPWLIQPCFPNWLQALLGWVGCSRGGCCLVLRLLAAAPRGHSPGDVASLTVTSPVFGTPRSTALPPLC